jgi:alkylhydroperoxidase family enzyme
MLPALPTDGWYKPFGKEVTPMDDRYTAQVQRLVEAVLRGAGDTDPDTRRVVEEHAAALGGRPVGAMGKLPAALDAYVDKVAQHAYKVTDDDIVALRQAGYSQDAIFEVTLSAALGAGLSRLERGLALLKGAR